MGWFLRWTAWGGMSQCPETASFPPRRFWPPSISHLSLAPFVIGGLVSIDTAADHSDENDVRIKGRKHCDSATCCGTMENIVCKGPIYEGKWEIPDC